MVKLASAKMGGVESIVMVRVVYAYFTNWGVNMWSVCKSDGACVGFPLAGGLPSQGDDNVDLANMTCYTGGETVFNNHQMCEVTSMSAIVAFFHTS
jgi:hypothetical protein